MASEPRRPLACAIYTRKSTEHGLEQDFNSLDAQREAAEAFIRSQAHEGWRCSPNRYDDGGLSGGTLERPALARLMADIAAGRVQVVVVYKIDRLTRSLSDFAKLVELFDAHQVSFVSVTQAFNTTTSMGRLTLNVLLSFAQFEREVIGERVRDKIAASKRKGLWVGGPVPMGYVVRDRKPAIDEGRADQVRWMFSRYLELGCLSALQREMQERGITSLRRRRADGRVCGGTPIGRGALAHILRNRFYLGEVAYKGKIYKGEQPALVARELFEAVQERLDRNAVERRNERLAGQALLTGLLFDSRGHPMSPSHDNKQGVRYRYYVSQAFIQGRKEEAGIVARVSAPDLEERVTAALRGLSRDDAAGKGDRPSDRDLVARQVERITLQEDRIEIRLRDRANATASCLAHEPVLSLPWTRHRSGVRQLTSPTRQRAISAAMRERLLKAIARARLCADLLMRGADSDLAVLAEREGVCERYLRLQLPIAFLAPRIIEAIAAGTISNSITLTRLCSGLPHRWQEQEKQLIRVMPAW